MSGIAGDEGPFAVHLVFQIITDGGESRQAFASRCLVETGRWVYVIVLRILIDLFIELYPWRRQITAQPPVIIITLRPSP